VRMDWKWNWILCRWIDKRTGTPFSREQLQDNQLPNGKLKLKCDTLRRRVSWIYQQSQHLQVVVGL
jgi:hypothetical protein